MEMYCPHCRQIDAFMKVSAIYRGETVTGSVPTNIPIQHQGHTNWIPTNYDVTMRSRLAEKLTPPTKPEKKNIGCGTAILLILLAIVASPLSMGSQKQGVLYLAIVFSPFFISLYRYSKFNTNTFPLLLQRWEYDISVWHNLYYCGRCDLLVGPSGKIQDLSYFSGNYSSLV